MSNDPVEELPLSSFLPNLYTTSTGSGTTSTTAAAASSTTTSQKQENQTSSLSTSKNNNNNSNFRTSLSASATSITPQLKSALSTTTTSVSGGRLVNNNNNNNNNNDKREGGGDNNNTGNSVVAAAQHGMAMLSHPSAALDSVNKEIERIKLKLRGLAAYYATTKLGSSNIVRENKMSALERDLALLEAQQKVLEMRVTEAASEVQTRAVPIMLPILKQQNNATALSGLNQAGNLFMTPSSNTTFQNESGGLDLLLLKQQQLQQEKESSSENNNNNNNSNKNRKDQQQQQQKKSTNKRDEKSGGSSSSSSSSSSSGNKDQHVKHHHEIPHTPLPLSQTLHDIPVDPCHMSHTELNSVVNLLRSAMSQAIDDFTTSEELGEYLSLSNKVNQPLQLSVASGAPTPSLVWLVANFGNETVIQSFVDECVALAPALPASCYPSSSSSSSSFNKNNKSKKSHDNNNNNNNNKQKQQEDFDRFLAKVCMWTRSRVAEVVLLLNCMEIASSSRPYSFPDCTELLVLAVDMKHTQLISSLVLLSSVVQFDAKILKKKNIFKEITLLGLTDIGEILCHRYSQDVILDSSRLLHSLFNSACDFEMILKEAVIGVSHDFAGTRGGGAEPPSNSNFVNLYSSDNINNNSNNNNNTPAGSPTMKTMMKNFTSGSSTISFVESGLAGGGITIDKEAELLIQQQEAQRMEQLFSSRHNRNVRKAFRPKLFPYHDTSFVSVRDLYRSSSGAEGVDVVEDDEDDDLVARDDDDESEGENNNNSGDLFNVTPSGSFLGRVAGGGGDASSMKNSNSNNNGRRKSSTDLYNSLMNDSDNNNGGDNNFSSSSSHRHQEQVSVLHESKGEINAAYQVRFLCPSLRSVTVRGDVPVCRDFSILEEKENNNSSSSSSPPSSSPLSGEAQQHQKLVDPNAYQLLLQQQAQNTWTMFEACVPVGQNLSAHIGSLSCVRIGWITEFTKDANGFSEHFVGGGGSYNNLNNNNNNDSNNFTSNSNASSSSSSSSSPGISIEISWDLGEKPGQFSVVAIYEGEQLDATKADFEIDTSLTDCTRIACAVNSKTAQAVFLIDGSVYWTAPSDWAIHLLESTGHHVHCSKFYPALSCFVIPAKEEEEQQNQQEHHHLGGGQTHLSPHLPTSTTAASASPSRGTSFNNDFASLVDVSFEAAPVPSGAVYQIPQDQTIEDSLFFPCVTVDVRFSHLSKQSLKGLRDHIVESNSPSAGGFVFGSTGASSSTATAGGGGMFTTNERNPNAAYSYGGMMHQPCSSSASSSSSLNPSPNSSRNQQQQQKQSQDQDNKSSSSSSSSSSRSKIVRLNIDSKLVHFIETMFESFAFHSVPSILNSLEAVTKWRRDLHQQKHNHKSNSNDNDNQKKSAERNEQEQEQQEEGGKEEGKLFAADGSVVIEANLSLDMHSISSEHSNFFSSWWHQVQSQQQSLPWSKFASYALHLIRRCSIHHSQLRSLIPFLVPFDKGFVKKFVPPKQKQKVNRQNKNEQQDQQTGIGNGVAVGALDSALDDPCRAAAEAFVILPPSQSLNLASAFSGVSIFCRDKFLLPFKSSSSSAENCDNDDDDNDDSDGSETDNEDDQDQKNEPKLRSVEIVSKELEQLEESIARMKKNQEKNKDEKSNSSSDDDEDVFGGGRKNSDMKSKKKKTKKSKKNMSEKMYLIPPIPFNCSADGPYPLKRQVSASAEHVTPFLSALLNRLRRAAFQLSMNPLTDVISGSILGMTPLMCAVALGYEEVVDVLVSRILVGVDTATSSASTSLSFSSSSSKSQDFTKDVMSSPARLFDEPSTPKNKNNNNKNSPPSSPASANSSASSSSSAASSTPLWFTVMSARSKYGLTSLHIALSTKRFDIAMRLLDLLPAKQCSSATGGNRFGESFRIQKSVEHYFHTQFERYHLDKLRQEQEEEEEDIKNKNKKLVANLGKNLGAFNNSAAAAAKSSATRQTWSSANEEIYGDLSVTARCTEVVEQKTSYGNSALLLACKLGATQIVKRLLFEFGADVAVTDTKGCSPLLAASAFGTRDACVAIVHYVRDMHREWNNFNRTAPTLDEPASEASPSSPSSASSSSSSSPSPSRFTLHDIALTAHRVKRHAVESDIRRRRVAASWSVNILPAKQAFVWCAGSLIDIPNQMLLRSTFSSYLEKNPVPGSPLVWACARGGGDDESNVSGFNEVISFTIDLPNYGVEAPGGDDKKDSSSSSSSSSQGDQQNKKKEGGGAEGNENEGKEDEEEGDGEEHGSFLDSSLKSNQENRSHVFITKTTSTIQQLEDRVRAEKAKHLRRQQQQQEKHEQQVANKEHKHQEQLLRSRLRDHVATVTPLLAAIAHGNESCALYLLEQCEAKLAHHLRANRSYHSSFGEPVVDASSLQTCASILNLDLIGDQRSKWTALHLASDCGMSKLCVKIIQLGAAVNSKDFSSSNPFHISCRNGFSDQSQSMVIAARRFLSVDARDGNGETLLHVACRNGMSLLIQTLVQDLRANANAASNDGLTPLHAVVLSESAAAFDTLLTICGSALDFEAKYTPSRHSRLAKRLKENKSGDLASSLNKNNNNNKNDEKKESTSSSVSKKEEEEEKKKEKEKQKKKAKLQLQQKNRKKSENDSEDEDSSSSDDDSDDDDDNDDENKKKKQKSFTPLELVLHLGFFEMAKRLIVQFSIECSPEVRRYVFDRNQDTLAMRNFTARARETNRSRPHRSAVGINAVVVGGEEAVSDLDQDDHNSSFSHSKNSGGGGAAGGAGRRMQVSFMTPSPSQTSLSHPHSSKTATSAAAGGGAGRPSVVVINTRKVNASFSTSSRHRRNHHRLQQSVVEILQSRFEKILHTSPGLFIVKRVAPLDTETLRTASSKKSLASKDPAYCPPEIAKGLLKIYSRFELIDIFSKLSQFNYNDVLSVETTQELVQILKVRFNLALAPTLIPRFCSTGLKQLNVDQEDLEKLSQLQQKVKNLKSPRIGAVGFGVGESATGTAGTGAGESIPHTPLVLDEHVVPPPHSSSSSSSSSPLLLSPLTSATNPTASSRTAVTRENISSLTQHTPLVAPTSPHPPSSSSHQQNDYEETTTSSNNNTNSINEAYHHNVQQNLVSKIFTTLRTECAAHRRYSQKEKEKDNNNNNKDENSVGGRGGRRGSGGSGSISEESSSVTLTTAASGRFGFSLQEDDADEKAKAGAFELYLSQSRSLCIKFLHILEAWLQEFSPSAAVLCQIARKRVEFFSVEGIAERMASRRSRNASSSSSKNLNNNDQDQTATTSTPTYATSAAFSDIVNETSCTSDDFRPNTNTNNNNNEEGENDNNSEEGGILARRARRGTQQQLDSTATTNENESENNPMMPRYFTFNEMMSCSDFSQQPPSAFTTSSSASATAVGGALAEGGGAGGQQEDSPLQIWSRELSSQLLHRLRRSQVNAATAAAASASGSVSVTPTNPSLTPPTPSLCSSVPHTTTSAGGYQNSSGSGGTSKLSHLITDIGSFLLAPLTGESAMQVAAEMGSPAGITALALVFEPLSPTLGSAAQTAHGLSLKHSTDFSPPPFFVALDACRPDTLDSESLLEAMFACLPRHCSQIVNDPFGSYGATPLAAAVKTANISAVESLLRYGAKPQLDFENPRNDTLLSAIYCDKTQDGELIRTLFAHCTPEIRPILRKATERFVSVMRHAAVSPSAGTAGFYPSIPIHDESDDDNNNNNNSDHDQPTAVAVASSASATISFEDPADSSTTSLPSCAVEAEKQRNSLQTPKREESNNNNSGRNSPVSHTPQESFTLPPEKNIQTGEQLFDPACKYASRLTFACLRRDEKRNSNSGHLPCFEKLLRILGDGAWSIIDLHSPEKNSLVHELLKAPAATSVQEMLEVNPDDSSLSSASPPSWWVDVLSTQQIQQQWSRDGVGMSSAAATSRYRRRPTGAGAAGSLRSPSSLGGNVTIASPSSPLSPSSSPFSPTSPSFSSATAAAAGSGSNNTTPFKRPQQPQQQQQQQVNPAPISIALPFADSSGNAFNINNNTNLQASMRGGAMLSFGGGIGTSVTRLAEQIIGENSGRTLSETRHRLVCELLWMSVFDHEEQVEPKAGEENETITTTTTVVKRTKTKVPLASYRNRNGISTLHWAVTWRHRGLIDTLLTEMNVSVTDAAVATCLTPWLLLSCLPTGLQEASRFSIITKQLENDQKARHRFLRLALPRTHPIAFLYVLTKCASAQDILSVPASEKQSVRFFWGLQLFGSFPEEVSPVVSSLLKKSVIEPLVTHFIKRLSCGTACAIIAARARGNNIWAGATTETDRLVHRRKRKGTAGKSSSSPSSSSAHSPPTPQNNQQRSGATKRSSTSSTNNKNNNFSDIPVIGVSSSSNFHPTSSTQSNKNNNNRSNNRLTAGSSTSSSRRPSSLSPFQLKKQKEEQRESKNEQERQKALRERSQQAGRLFYRPTSSVGGGQNNNNNTRNTSSAGGKNSKSHSAGAAAGGVDALHVEQIAYSIVNAMFVPQAFSSSPTSYCPILLHHSVLLSLRLGISEVIQMCHVVAPSQLRLTAFFAHRRARVVAAASGQEAILKQFVTNTMESVIDAGCDDAIQVFLQNQLQQQQQAEQQQKMQNAAAAAGSLNSTLTLPPSLFAASSSSSPSSPPGSPRSRRPTSASDSTLTSFLNSSSTLLGSTAHNACMYTASISKLRSTFFLPPTSQEQSKKEQQQQQQQQRAAAGGGAGINNNINSDRREDTSLELKYTLLDWIIEGSPLVPINWKPSRLFYGRPPPLGSSSSSNNKKPGTGGSSASSSGNSNTNNGNSTSEWWYNSLDEWYHISNTGRRVLHINKAEAVPFQRLRRAINYLINERSPLSPALLTLMKSDPERWDLSSSRVSPGRHGDSLLHISVLREQVHCSYFLLMTPSVRELRHVTLNKSGRSAADYATSPAMLQLLSSFGVVHGEGETLCAVEVVPSTIVTQFEGFGGPADENSIVSRWFAALEKRRKAIMTANSSSSSSGNASMMVSGLRRRNSSVSFAQQQQHRLSSGTLAELIQQQQQQQHQFGGGGARSRSNSFAPSLNSSAAAYSFLANNSSFAGLSQNQVQRLVRRMSGVLAGKRGDTPTAEDDIRDDFVSDLNPRRERDSFGWQGSHKDLTGITSQIEVDRSSSSSPASSSTAATAAAGAGANLIDGLNGGGGIGKEEGALDEDDIEFAGRLGLVALPAWMRGAESNWGCEDTFQTVDEMFSSLDFGTKSNKRGKKAGSNEQQLQRQQAGREGEEEAQQDDDGGEDEEESEAVKQERERRKKLLEHQGSNLDAKTARALGVMQEEIRNEKRRATRDKRFNEVARSLVRHGFAVSRAFYEIHMQGTAAAPSSTTTTTSSSSSSAYPTTRNTPSSNLTTITTTTGPAAQKQSLSVNARTPLVGTAVTPQSYSSLSNFTTTSSTSYSTSRAGGGVSHILASAMEDLHQHRTLQTARLPAPPTSPSPRTTTGGKRISPLRKDNVSPPLSSQQLQQYSSSSSSSSSPTTATNLHRTTSELSSCTTGTTATTASHHYQSPSSAQPPPNQHDLRNIAIVHERSALKLIYPPKAPTCRMFDSSPSSSSSSSRLGKATRSYSPTNWTARSSSCSSSSGAQHAEGQQATYRADVLLVSLPLFQVCKALGIFKDSQFSRSVHWSDELDAAGKEITMGKIIEQTQKSLSHSHHHHHHHNHPSSSSPSSPSSPLSSMSTSDVLARNDMLVVPHYTASRK